MYAKAKREELARVAASLQGIIDKAKTENNRGLTADERTQFDAMVNDHSTLEQDIARAEQADTITAKLARTDNPGKIVDGNLEQVQDEFRVSNAAAKARAKDPHYSVYSKYLRNGVAALDADEIRLMGQPIQNTMSTGTGSQGGYVIPQGFSGQLEEAMKWFGGIEPGVVEIFDTESGNPFPWPTNNDTSNRGRIIGQNVQVTQTDPTFGQVNFAAYIGSSDLVLIPLALIQDSYFDLNALIAKMLGMRLGRLYNWKCTVGTGTNEPTGIVTAAVAAGSINAFPTGSVASIAYNDLVNTEHTVDPAYRLGGRWMFHDAVLKLLKKLVDGSGRPLWQPGLTASFRDGAAVDMIAARPMILDHPYIINNDMDAPAASKNTVLYGDTTAFKVRRVSGGTTILRLAERYADYLQVGYTAFQRFDSNLIDAGTHPIAVGQQSAT